MKTMLIALMIALAGGFAVQTADAKTKTKPASTSKKNKKHSTKKAADANRPAPAAQTTAAVS